MTFPHARVRMRAGALAALLAIPALLLSLGTPAAAADVPRHHPSRLAHVGSAGQVIVVTAPAWGSSQATLRAYERDGQGGWRAVVGATPARLGWNGMAPEQRRKQGTGTTPAGTFAIPRAFGRLADPGTALPYRQFDTDDAWTYNPRRPATYNVYQTVDTSWRTYGGYVERLWSYGKQYHYVAVLDYNLPRGPVSRGTDGVWRTSSPADTSAGGGIFLHVSNGKSTAGCIAVPESTMREILRWLSPQRKPVIVIGPEAEIGRM